MSSAGGFAGKVALGCLRNNVLSVAKSGMIPAGVMAARGGLRGLVSQCRSSEEFQQMLGVATKGIAVVDFYATWCAPCRILEPKFARLAEDYKTDASFIKVDIDEVPDLADSEEIRSVPTVKVYKRGNFTEAYVGTDAAEQVRETVLD